MLNPGARFTVLLAAALFTLSPIANADLVAPVLEIDSSDAGDSISGDGSSLVINGTGISIITDFGPPVTYDDITDVDFVLTADRGGSSGIDYFFTNGTITAGSYINTTFDSLTITDLGFGTSFAADLANGGRIEGGFIIASGAIASSFTGSFLTAKASIVPVPAAVWLFGTGLLGLIGVARRK
jgi:hypothetical protein